MQVAEVFVGAFLQVMLDRMASRVLLQFSERQGIRSGLKELEEKLKMITEVIAHAENMLFRETEVDEWLEELRDWAFDADDFLDEVNTRAMQEKEEEKEEEGTSNNTSSSISFSSFIPPIVTRVRDFGSRFISAGTCSQNVAELNSRFDAICKRRNEMRRLMNMTATEDTSTPPAKRRRLLEGPAGEFDARVFGREQEKERIIEQLKSGGDANVEVIAIVGMPGIGKTTLARDVFDSVSDDFDIKGWVCVSNDFDVIRITRAIIKSFTSRASDSSELYQLRSDLNQELL